MDDLRLVLNSYNGNNPVYCGRWISQNSCGDVMTDAEQDNAGDISAMRCAIRSLSDGVGTITAEQGEELDEICNELCDLTDDITRREG